jgi:hypothetical protein
MEAQPHLTILKALADENRLRLIGLLAERERSVQEVAALLGIREPTASHHLARLREAGLVRLRQEGTTHWYAFESEAIQGLARTLGDPAQVAGFASDVAADGFERQVLANFLAPDGTLSTIPASRKKRRALLAALVREFEEDRRFPESEINERLKRRHWDCATLRRELIGYRMMARADGFYWRLPEADWVAE